jgi:hypothetical protein
MPRLSHDRLVVRTLAWLLAWGHSFPAIKHLRALVDVPSLAEAYKGLGAAAAVVLYLAPTEWQARALVGLWHRRRSVLTVACVALVVVHAIPALDHVPSFLHDPTWADAWRGFGAAVAVVWFTLPTPTQARALAVLARPSRYSATIRMCLQNERTRRVEHYS